MGTSPFVGAWITWRLHFVASNHAYALLFRASIDWTAVPLSCFVQAQIVNCRVRPYIWSCSSGLLGLTTTLSYPHQRAIPSRFSIASLWSTCQPSRTHASLYLFPLNFYYRHAVSRVYAICSGKTTSLSSHPPSPSVNQL